MDLTRTRLSVLEMEDLDLDGDGEVSISEARAGMYRRLEKQTVQARLASAASRKPRTSALTLAAGAACLQEYHITKDHYKGHRRYTKSQEKALRLLEHSRDVFGYDVVVPEDRNLVSLVLLSAIGAAPLFCPF